MVEASHVAANACLIAFADALGSIFHDNSTAACKVTIVARQAATEERRRRVHRFRRESFDYLSPV